MKTINKAEVLFYEHVALTVDIILISQFPNYSNIIFVVISELWGRSLK